jgi:hypothetical protein
MKILFFFVVLLSVVTSGVHAQKKIPLAYAGVKIIFTANNMPVALGKTDTTGKCYLEVNVDSGAYLFQITKAPKIVSRQGKDTAVASPRLPIIMDITLKDRSNNISVRSVPLPAGQTEGFLDLTFGQSWEKGFGGGFGRIVAVSLFESTN